MTQPPTIGNSNIQRLTYSIVETSKILGCSPSLLYKLANKLPFCLHLGDRWIVSRSKLEQYLAGEGGNHG